MGSLPHWQDERARIRSLLARRRVGLISDIDGTISRLTATPEQARVEPRCRAALGRLARRLALVAVVSGRSARDACAMLALERVTCVGNHGLEVLADGRLQIDAEARLYVQRIGEVVDAVAGELNEPGILIENKQVTASIHYRQARDPAAARRRIRQVLAPAVRDRGLRVTEGKQVIELRPPIRRDKGTAARRLIDDASLDGVIYLGDDTTDVAAFAAVHRWAGPNGDAALAVAVRGRETPGEVLAAADVTAEGVEDVAELLASMAET